MAMQSHQHRSSEPTEGQEGHFFMLDALCCEEEQTWEEEEEDLDDDSEEDCPGNGREPSSLLPLMLLEQDLFCEDEELLSLFSKEQAQRQDSCLGTENRFSPGRVEAVGWMLRVSAHYGFSALTAMLATDYLDRFLSRFLLKSDKLWMTQLAAVACLSLAAKVEETCVPLLLDFQVGESKYAFEAKAIQRMELLVLSTLGWKMHPVTPLSFLDHIVQRLGLKCEVHREFFQRCETLLLAVLSDSRSVGYLPSVLAAAAMLHVTETIETGNPTEHKAQLLHVLRMSKEEVDGCYQLILGISTPRIVSQATTNSHKRKLDQVQDCLSIGAIVSLSSASEYDVTGDHPRVKRSRVQVLENSLCKSSTGNVRSLGRVFMDAVHSPP